MSGIWIRSQSGKDLVYAVRFRVNSYKSGAQEIVSMSPASCFLGEYAAESRALEVLDELELFRQDRLQSSYDIGGRAFFDHTRDTYHMPKE